MIPPGENDFQRPLKMTDSVIRYHVPFQKLPVHGQNFRHQEGAVLSRPVGQRLDPGKHILVSLHRGILVGTHPGIDIQALYLLGKPVVERKAGIKGIRAVSQPPLVGSIFVYFPGGLFKHLFPQTVLRHHILQFPGILYICFASFFHAEHTPSNTILNWRPIKFTYIKFAARGTTITVISPATAMERLLMAPSISPISSALAVPTAWALVPMARPFATG